MLLFKALKKLLPLVRRIGQQDQDIGGRPAGLKGGKEEFDRFIPAGLSGRLIIPSHRLGLKKPGIAHPQNLPATEQAITSERGNGSTDLLLLAIAVDSGIYGEIVFADEGEQGDDDDDSVGDDDDDDDRQTIDDITDDTVSLSISSETEGPCTADLGPTTFELPVDQDLAGYTVDVTFED